MWALLIFELLLINAAAPMEAAQLPMYSQTSRLEATDGRKRVAIIGGGIAGSSIAYRLHDEYRSILPLDITVYETASQVGGRINSTWIDDGEEGYVGFVDTGTQSFSADDSVGVWDGRELILRRHGDLKSRTWQDFARNTWKYGTSPRQLRTLLEDKLPRFRSLYREHSYINPNLPDVIQQLDLAAESEQSAEDFFLENGISSKFLHDIVQPTARALYAHNLGDLNGLSALIAMNPSATYRINSHPRGNSELVYRLLRLSEAQIHLSLHVTKIGRSSQGKYTVTASMKNILQDNTHDTSKMEEGTEYDAVVIATHLQGADIQFDFLVPQTHSPITLFVERHVTVVTSPLQSSLSPGYLNLSSAEEIPDLIYTTQDSKSRRGPEIFSIERSYASTCMDGDVLEAENLYKITSAERIPDSIIAEMFGKSPETPPDALGIRWIHRQVWPLASLNRTRGPRLDNIELADGLFYTGIGEELVSSMEMSCKMGGRVADMIFQKLAPPVVEAEEWF